MAGSRKKPNDRGSSWTLRITCSSSISAFSTKIKHGSKRIEETPTAQALSGTSLALVRKTLPRVTWRTRAEHLLQGCETEVQRKDVEERERNRWIQNLVHELLESTKLIEEAQRAERGSKYS